MAAKKKKKPVAALPVRKSKTPKAPPAKRKEKKPAAANVKARLAASLERDKPAKKPKIPAPAPPDAVTVRTTKADSSMKLILKGSTRGELEDQAREFLGELDGADLTAPPVSGDAVPAKRSRGRPRKADVAAAATAAAVETAASAPPPAAPIPGHLSTLTAAQAASNGGPTKEQMLEAASRLIDAKGEPFCAALLEKNYKAVTFTGVPVARYAELIAEVNHILAAPKGLLG